MPAINNRIFIIGLFFFIFTSIHAVAQGTENKSSSVVGRAEGHSATWYAVIKTARGDKKLYIKGDIFCSEINISHCLRIHDIRKDLLELRESGSDKAFTLKPGDKIPLEGPEIIFDKTVAAGVIEYRYNEVPGAKKNQAEDFMVRSLEQEKLVVEKDHNGNHRPEGLTDKEKELFDSPEIQEKASEGLKADIFERIDLKKIGPGTWAVNAENADIALNNIGRSLFSVIRGVQPRYRFGEGPSLELDSELGDVVVNKDGFLIQNLAVGKIVERAGIRQGDLIRSINGQKVNSLFGIYKAYMNIKSNPDVNTVSVEIIRDEKPRILKYKIR